MPKRSKSGPYEIRTQSQNPQDSSEQACNSFGFDQLAGLLQMVVNDGIGIDSEGVIDTGEQFGRMDRLFGRAAAGRIGFAVHMAAFDACAGDDGSVAVGPVVAAIRTVFVAGGADAFLRTASEFAYGDDQGLAKK